MKNIRYLLALGFIVANSCSFATTVMANFWVYNYSGYEIGTSSTEINVICKAGTSNSGCPATGPIYITPGGGLGQYDSGEVGIAVDVPLDTFNPITTYGELYVYKGYSQAKELCVYTYTVSNVLGANGPPDMTLEKEPGEGDECSTNGKDNICVYGTNGVDCPST